MFWTATDCYCEGLSCAQSQAFVCFPIGFSPGRIGQHSALPASLPLPYMWVISSSGVDLTNRFCKALNYPSICLLIAAVHAQTSGHDAFTFEMLHESFREQVRTSLSAPVQVGGGNIGMVRCSREVMFRV